VRAHARARLVGGGWRRHEYCQSTKHALRMNPENALGKTGRTGANDALLARGNGNNRSTRRSGKLRRLMTCDLAAIFVLSRAFLSGGRGLAIANVPGAACASLMPCPCSTAECREPSGVRRIGRCGSALGLRGSGNIPRKVRVRPECSEEARLPT